MASKNMVGRAPAPKKPAGKGGGLFIGILMGMVMGLLVAGGVAWYLMRLPSPFTQPEHETAAPVSDKPLVAVPPRVKADEAPAEEPAAKSDKPRFEFYNVLTDKQPPKIDTSKSDKVIDKSVDSEAPAKTIDAAVTDDNVKYYLQAGSFATAADADNEKARLAMNGLDASIQTAFVPDKGPRHRVVFGPYKGSAEMTKARNTLRQSGVSTTPIKAQ